MLWYLKQTVELDRPLVRFARAFNAEQIDGMPPQELTDRAFEWEPIEKAENILSASGANIRHDQSNRAFYRYATDSIHLPPRENFEEPGLYYGTALTSWGTGRAIPHAWTGKTGPSARRRMSATNCGRRSPPECSARISVIPHDPEQHAAYVSSWIKALEDNPYEIVRACQDAEQIKGYLLGLEREKELAVGRPDHAPAMGSLLCQEIHFRLLTNPFGNQLRSLNTLGSQGNKIAQAIKWLKDNYNIQLRVEDLAERFNMAPSTFHKHFKEITTLSPLQYQKQLRLGEAQRLMLSDNYDVMQAAFAVGYESTTQFNREYKRLFGESPRKNVLRLKAVPKEQHRMEMF